MNVDTFIRLDRIALELPPNDSPSFAVYPSPVIQGLGGLTAPSMAGGMIPPQNLPKHPAAEGDVARAFVLGSAAPPDRQDYWNDGGSIIATTPPSVIAQENQKGVVDILGDADMRVLEEKNFFQPGQYPDEGK